ncbi:MAG: YARHG domain-containing protein [Treponema sp.]|jgi:hypothetical protein|nr:YARHG domain-containing protein [Treponema sp.]
MRGAFGKIYFIMAMCLISVNATAQNISTRTIIAGDVSYLNSIIEPEYIRHLSKSDLRLLRNTIFAKYNYEFVSEDLKKHFSAFSWYKGGRTNVQPDLNRTDWLNVAAIMSLENFNSPPPRDTGGFGERLIISDTLYPLKYYSEDPGEMNINGELIAYVDKVVPGRLREERVEVGRAKITDGKFYLHLDEVPQNMLNPWKDEWLFRRNPMECSDPETKTAELHLKMTGTLPPETIDEVYSTTKNLFTEKPLLRQYSLSETKSGYKQYENGSFHYVYSDRDALIRGVDHEEDPGQAKTIFNVSLKKGWNKIKYYRAEIKDFGRYNLNIHIYETAFEKGGYYIYYFDLDDYINNTRRQPATLQGRIVIEKKNDLQEYFYFVLNKPLGLGNGYGEIVEHKRVLLAVNNHETFPRRGKYILYGDIDFWWYSTKYDEPQM